MVRFWLNEFVVSIRSPNLSDTDSHRLNVQRTFDMGGQPHTFLGLTTSEILTMTFSALSRNKTLEIRAFILNTLGQVVNYEDYNSVQWTGRILTDPYTITAEGRGCMDSVTITFEGNHA